MKTTALRNSLLALAIAALGVAPAAAVAKHGADNGVAELGDDKGGLRADGVSDDGPGDDMGGLRDDRAGRKRSEKRVAGSCTGRSSAKLKAKPDDGRLEVEYEVDQNRNGVTWTVRMRRDGKLVVKTRATTKAPSGSFSVERRIRNPRGSDRIVARATSPSGEVCRASLTI